MTTAIIISTSRSLAPADLAPAERTRQREIDALYSDRARREAHPQHVMDVFVPRLSSSRL